MPRLNHFYSLVPEDPESRNVVNSTFSSSTLATSSFARGGYGFNTSSHLQHSSSALVTLKATRLFRRRRGAHQGRVLINDSDLTIKSEPMDAGRARVLPNQDAKHKASRSKWSTLPNFVRNIFQQINTGQHPGHIHTRHDGYSTTRRGF